MQRLVALSQPHGLAKQALRLPTQTKRRRHPSRCKQTSEETLSSLDDILGLSSEEESDVEDKDSTVAPMVVWDTAPLRAIPSSKETQLTDQQLSSYSKLQEACRDFVKAPIVQRPKFSKAISDSLEELQELDAIPRWGSAKAQLMNRRPISNRDLRMIGIKSPETLAAASVRNDATFITILTLVASVIAVATSYLPGDWGFFVPYLSGSTVLVALAIGSTNPGLLQVVIDKFAQIFPDYRNRVLSHEAAHFLLGYLLGIPVAGYSLSIGKQHTEFAEAKLQARLEQRKLEEEDVDILAVVAMAGVAQEGLLSEEVMGQSGDLVDLQRVLYQSKDRLAPAEQQNITRWAVCQAAGLLKAYKSELESLKTSMS